MPDIFISGNKETKAKEAPQNKQEPVKVSETPHFKKRINHLSAFVYNPSRVNFTNKDPEEKVVLILRKHPITLIKWIVVGTAMVIAPAIFPTAPFFNALPAQFQLVAVLAWYLVTFAFFIEQFISWFFSVNIVTDERVFDVNFINMIYRQMTDADIDDIQDVTVVMGSAIRTVFNYGDVLIQTASEIPRIVFEAVPEPDKVARILRELRLQEEQEKLEGRIR